MKPIDSTLRLIQFVGPVKNAWINELVASGLELIAYVPNNGYLVRGDSRSRDRLMARNQAATARSEGFVQWEGPFLDSYKVHPALVRSMTEPSGEITVAVQLALGKRVTNARDNTEVQAVKHLASAVMVDAYGVLGFTNLRIKIESSRVADLAALPSVVNIEPWNAPQLFDERASQIIAGELTSDGTAPRGPGYLAWLAAHGLSSAFSFGIDVADSGLDRGVITPDKLHPDFLDSNKQSRVVYARDYTSDSIRRMLADTVRSISRSPAEQPECDCSRHRRIWLRHRGRAVRAARVIQDFSSERALRSDRSFYEVDFGCVSGWRARCVEQLG